MVPPPPHPAASTAAAEPSSARRARMVESSHRAIVGPDGHGHANAPCSRPRGRVRAPRARDRRARPALRARRPRRVLGQRGRHAAPRRRQADPRGHEVGALPGAAGARSSSATPASAARWRSRCPRRCGWPATACDDLVVAYPTADRAALRELADRPRATRTRITVMVDSSAQLDLIDAARRRRPPAAARLPRPRRRLVAAGRAGCRSAPSARRCARPTQAAALAREIAARPGFELVGMMAYEAQIAGVGDRPPGSALRGRGDPLRCSARSARELRRAPRRGGGGGARRWRRCEFVNGGGTGSLEGTAAEAAVTEVAAGSGLYGPTLFDAYRAFSARGRRRCSRCRSCAGPRPAIATVLGGGYLASGAGRPGAAAAPAPARRPAPRRPGGRGRGADAAARRAGARPARSATACGSATPRPASCASASTRCTWSRASAIVDEVPTYRGEGRCFL